jgi:hypothetical protein
MRRTTRLLGLAAALGSAAVAACLANPGKTDRIDLVSTVEEGGWKWDFHRNRSYPCSISGYQTFLIGTRIGSDPTAAAPLWVRMHGGGVGWFDETGAPMPTAGNKTEESRTKLLGFVDHGRDAESLPLIAARFHPGIQNPANQPDLIVAGGALDVPILHVWNQGDDNACGDLPMICPVRDGTTEEMGAASCRAENLRRAIAAEGPASRSLNLGVCVESADHATACDVHVVTTRKNGVNLDPSLPADYLGAILAWVRARLADA